MRRRRVLLALEGNLGTRAFLHEVEMAWPARGERGCTASPYCSAWHSRGLRGRHLPGGALEGFEIAGTTGKESGDRPVVCARQISRYSVEISWSDEADHGPDATKAVWEVEVLESASDLGGGSKVHIVHVAPHAPDALRIAKGLVRFYHALTQRSRRQMTRRLSPSPSRRRSKTLGWF
jgi:hypothetical protein